MTNMFADIPTATDMSFQKEGDICWGCHSGYNWLDPVGTGGGVDTFVNYTTDLDIPQHGNVVGTEANTHGAGTEDIQEVDIGGLTIFANYTVDLDQPNAANHGTVTGTYQDIDEINPADGNFQTITEVVSGGGGWVNLFTETFSGTDVDWLGDDDGETAPSDEYWFVADAAPDNDDFQVGVYSGQNCLRTADEDSAAGTHYAEALDAGADWNPSGSGWLAGYVNFSYNYILDTGESIYFDVNRDGGWVNIWTITSAANNEQPGWTLYSYALVAADLAATQFSWRVYTDGNQQNDIGFFDDFTLDVNQPGGTSSLEHRWRTQNVPGGATTLTLSVEARHNTGSDDTFTVGWSTDDITYNPTTITINSDALTVYTWNFPAATSGVLYLRVIDDNAGDNQNDDVIFGRIWIMHESTAASEYSLEHRWRTQNIPGGADDLTLLVNASRAAGDDDFDIGYSTVVGGPYTPVITVNNVAMTAYSAAIPVMSGQIYINVVDTNTGDAVQQDTVVVDEIRVMWHDFAPAAGSGLRLQVWTEPDYTVNVWNDTSSAFEQIYPRVVTGCEDCHDDFEINQVPFGSGKFIDHLNETVANYDYTQCTSCHNTAVEPWFPHNIPHDIDIDWTAYASAGDTNVNNDFCDVICHYSDLDSRPVYQDASTPWMQDIYTSFTNDGALHTTSTDIDGDGTVECVDCHLDHLLKPDDTDDAGTEPQLYGGSSVQGCGDQDIGVSGCHLVDNGVVDAWDNRETPPTHGTGVSWTASGRDDCTEANCHDKHNYPLDPTEGHDPK
jgi:hypothetical protein